MKDRFEREIVNFFQFNLKSCDLYKAQDKLTKMKESFKKISEKDHAKKQTELTKLKLQNDEVEAQTIRAIRDHIPKWFDDRCSDSESFNDETRFRKSTHLMKFGNVSSPPFSINCLLYKGNVNQNVLSTLTISKNIEFDISYNNGKYINHALFFLIKIGNKTIYEYFEEENFELFDSFTSDSERKKLWISGFKNLMSDHKFFLPQKIKQIYFPVEKYDYHLVCPLFSSSLAHSIYEKTFTYKFSESYRQLKHAYSEKKYAEGQFVRFPEVAIQRFGGEHPRNASPLNHLRRGNAYLLSCQPPTWKRQDKPPQQGKNAFWQAYARRCRKTVNFLKDYLEKIYELPSIKGRRDFRAELVDELVDSLLGYAAEIQAKQEWAGWSRECELSRAEQLWLDPLRSLDDDNFRIERQSNDWQTEIAQQFARWLNHTIGHKSDKLYPDDHTYHQWQRLLERKLALLKDDLEMAL